MSKTKTLTTIDPLLFLEGEPIDETNALAVLEMLNWAMAETLQQSGADLALSADVIDSISFEYEIPTFADELEAYVLVVPLDPSVAVDVDIDIGSDTQTISIPAGSASGTATFAVADTGTGYVSVSLLGTITAGIDTAYWGDIQIRMTPIAAADLPDPS